MIITFSKLRATIAATILLGAFSCKKDRPAPDVLKLYDMPLAKVKSLIAGKWQIQRSKSSVCGVVGCSTMDTLYPKGQGEEISFLANDTIRWFSVDRNQVKFYERATVKRYGNGYAPGALFVSDSLYAYELRNAISPLFVGEMRKDTLVVQFNITYHYMTRQ